MLKLENEQIVLVDNATIYFKKGTINSITAYSFDTSEQGHPMVNAMAGLAVLKEGEKLLMLNHTAPMGLFPKVEQDFEYSYENTPEGLCQIIFTKKIGTNGNTNFELTSCSGGCD